MSLYNDEQHINKKYRSRELDKIHDDFIKSSIRGGTKPPYKSKFRKQCDDIFNRLEKQTEWLRQNKEFVLRNCPIDLLKKIDLLDETFDLNLFRSLRSDPNRLFNDETFAVMYTVLSKYHCIIREILILKSQNQAAMSPFVPYLFNTLISIGTVAIMYIRMISKMFFELIENVMVYVNWFYIPRISRDEKRYCADKASDLLEKIVPISTWLSTGIWRIHVVMGFPLCDVPPNLDRWQLQELSSVRARLNPNYEKKINESIHKITFYANLMSDTARELLTESDTDTDRPDGHGSDSDSDGGHPGRVVLPAGL
jgi:hypothetical protein